MERRLDDLTTNANYNTVPTARVTDGEGFGASLTFDNFGRLTGATITSQGNYYSEVPELRLVDASGTGRGALLSATINTGNVTAVNIAASGIDPATTTLQAVTPGSGCTLEVQVESFTFDLRIDRKLSKHFT